MQNKIIFSQTQDIENAKKLLDMGINIIGETINTKNKCKIFHHKDEKFSDEINSYIHNKILKITNENDLEIYKNHAIMEDSILLIDCDDLYDSLYLHTKIPKNHQSIIRCDHITPHKAYMIFSIGSSGILCNSNEIFQNGDGKFIHKLNLTHKKAKNDRFYFKFFNTKKPFTQLRNIKIDRIFDEFQSDSIAINIDNPHLNTFLYVLKNKDIVKIGIVNNRNQFKIARNLQDNAMLDVLEVESSDNLEYANFAFYSKLDSKFNMQIVD